MQNKLIKAIEILLVISIITLLIVGTMLLHTKPKNIENAIKNDISLNEINNTTNIENIDVIDYEASDYEPDNLIGTLNIPKLNLDAEIMEGTSDEVLAYYIGHFENTSIWDGNIALASHNRGNNVVHYFENINQLVEGDEIIYTTKLGERRYFVYNIREISSTDFSIIEESEENIITLITCITGKSELRLCVQAKEILE